MLVGELFARIDSGQIELTGDGGMISALIKEALKCGLQAEMGSHRGYDPRDRQAKAEPRNSYKDFRSMWLGTRPRKNRTS